MQVHTSFSLFISVDLCQHSRKQTGAKSQKACTAPPLFVHQSPNKNNHPSLHHQGWRNPESGGKGCSPMYILRIFQDEKAIKTSDQCFMTEDLPTPIFSVAAAPVFTFDPRQIIVHISRGFCQEFTLALKQTGSASSTIQRVSSKRNISRKTSQCNCYFVIFIATWYH